MSDVNEGFVHMSLRGVRHSIRKKLMLVVLVTTFIALLLTGAAMLFYDLRTYHESWVSDMVAQADLTGRSSAAALSFDDEKVAQENLSLLKGRPKITAAAIYTAKGALFASYARPEEGPTTFPSLPEADGYRVDGDHLLIFKRIEGNREILGTVYLKARYELMERLKTYLGILAAVMAASLLIALLVTSWLQSTVTRPILAVTDVAQQVMTRRDFSLRVQRTTDDEVGYLVDAFNAMLAEIGGRTRDLEESYRTLEMEMTERRSAEEALVAAGQQKDEFLATLAHELRNPLAPLRNSLEILRRVGNNSDAAQATRDVMDRQLRQMVHLVNDLLDVSRISTGKMILKKERALLQDIVQVALETATPIIEARRHKISVSLPGQPVYLMADPTRIAQVLVNLLNNAAKFTEAGGDIALQASVEASEIVIMVSDTGVGIPADMLPAIFGMFTQVDRSLDRAQAGLGVGLSLSRHLVGMHGGTIVASSNGLGRGSRFTVRLPILPPTARPPEPAPVAARSADPRKLRILLADDNVDFAASLAMLLRETGHEVQVTNDGMEALEAAATFKPDLAFLDIGLPKLHGYDLARRLRAGSQMQHGVLVAVSGWGQEEDKRRSREAGFDMHLVKPVEFQQIGTVLAKYFPATPEDS